MEEAYMKELNDWIDTKKKEADEKYIRSPKNTEKVLGEYESALNDLYYTTTAEIINYLTLRDSSKLNDLGWKSKLIEAITDTFNRTTILDELNTRLRTFPHERNRQLAKELKNELYMSN